MLTKKTVLAAAMAALCACSGGGPRRPSLAAEGRPAPELKLPKLMNAPVKELRGWDSLKGKVVVLDFWATWSDECARTIQSLNALAARFKDRPVVIIHITDESSSAVARFLGRVRVDGWVAPEAGAGMFKAFRVYSRPRVVLVDAGGKVAALYSAAPGADAVMRLLAGSAGEFSARPSTGPALAEFYVARSAAGSGSAQYGPGHLEAVAMPLSYALEWAFGRTDRLEISASAAAVMNRTYDLRLSAPPGRDGKELLLAGLRAALGLRAARTEEDSEVYVLAKAPGGPVGVKAARGYGAARIDGAVLRVDGGSFAALAERLGAALNAPVRDETSAPGPYQYSFTLDTADPAAMDAELRGRLGLRLFRARRKITALKVSGGEGK